MAKQYYTLFDDFQYKGQWWLPDNPKRRVGGTLSFAKGRITLDLLDSFEELKLPHHFGGGEEQNPDIIHGITNNGVPCTLLKTLFTNRTLHSSGVQMESYLVHFLLVGKLYSSVDDVEFSSVSTHYSYLEEWLSYKPFKTDCLDKTGARASFQFPESFEIDVESIKARISLDGQFLAGGEAFRSLRWDYEASIKITPNDRRGYEWFLETVHSLANLLTLLTGDAIYPRRITARGDDIQIGDGKTTKETIEVFYSLPRSNPLKALRPFEMIAPFPIIRKNIDSVLQNWFQKSLMFKPACGLFFSTFYSLKMHLEAVFLNLTQAIESYHRRKYPGNYVGEEEYDRFVKVLTDALPSEMPRDLKTSLKNRLQYGNEYSLRKRVVKVLGSIPENIRQQIIDSPKAFTQTIIDTRNYLTHYDKKLEREALKGMDLYVANERLSIFLTILLLKELGLEDNVIATRISKTKRFKNLRYLANSE